MLYYIDKYGLFPLFYPPSNSLTNITQIPILSRLMAFFIFLEAGVKAASDYWEYSSGQKVLEQIPKTLVFMAFFVNVSLTYEDNNLQLLLFCLFLENI